MNTKTKGDSAVVDLTTLAAKIYVGRSNGKLARKHFKISELDEAEVKTITVQFPDDAETMTSSFFLGMFGESVVRYKTKAEFLKKYSFNANDTIKEEISISIDEALMAE